MKNIKIALLLLILLTLGCQSSKNENNENASVASDFEVQVQEYIAKFPYQDTYDYMIKFTGNDPAKLNTWVMGETPVLVKAGEDKVVRMNNDTYYKIAFVDLSKGPVILGSANPSDDRFYSFQLMDDRNANYANVINPSGNYLLHLGEAPQANNALPIQVPSSISVVIVRVEVKNVKDQDDLMQAEKIFRGITIEGPEISEFSQLDLFSQFDDKVIERGNVILDSILKVVPFRLMVALPEQIGKSISVVNHAAGTKGGWGGPVTSHSAYESLYFDADGNRFNGSKGTYTVTTKAPPVDAFWSLTVYDTERGGYLHPNKDDRYHLNNTVVIPSDDGTYTFLFKTSCDETDQNCLEIPEGEFDIAARYYLPSEAVQKGEWLLPTPVLRK